MGDKPYIGARHFLDAVRNTGAAETIESIKADRDRLAARVEELEAALRPFVGSYSIKNWDDVPDAQMSGARISHGQLRAAARALQPDGARS